MFRSRREPSIVYENGVTPIRQHTIVLDTSLFNQVMSGVTKIVIRDDYAFQRFDRILFKEQKGTTLTGAEKLCVVSSFEGGGILTPVGCIELIFKGV